MPQNEYIEQHRKLYGRRYDHEFRQRKKQARSWKKRAYLARKLHGRRAKLFGQKRYKQKMELKKKIAMHGEKTDEHKNDKATPKGAIPAYLMDREGVSRSKVLSNTIKQKRKEKAGKWDVPISKMRAVPEAEIFKVLRSGKSKRKQWKRLVTKVCFVPPHFTRKPPKFERFIRPNALRFKKAHVTHPELKTTFHLEILAVKKNPHSPLYTSLGVITKGCIVEVNVSELGLVTPAGKIVWGKYAQVTNNPELDGCINAVLLV
mmetsp:Transcript_32731/g.52385  ORF Transcript_32731/g.52385 Transcript_32731/m.52385 type:complete len:261 (+) Transcript_32731:55-837(+)|eukprot:CAMPEP_0197022790 /NCGR_PEP_ID=MMETSP1384-20130603/3601_1 /TAXON_ID=29189 /ORGANISM="Ammonia sp." /LENGTH=260 /DNA_ID=CAMNT_0042450893 /DNA_START=43 /DNA_END=825 /DNA_ORIENTATION=+